MAVGLYYGKQKINGGGGNNYVSCYDLDYANNFLNQVCGTSDVVYFDKNDSSIKTKSYDTTEANSLLNQILGTTDVTYYN